MKKLNRRRGRGGLSATVWYIIQVCFVLFLKESNDKKDSQMNRKSVPYWRRSVTKGTSNKTVLATSTWRRRVNSRLQVLGGEIHIWGVNSMHFLMFFVFWVFFWEEDLGFWGESHQEIAGNNTGEGASLNWNGESGFIHAFSDFRLTDIYL